MFAILDKFRRVRSGTKVELGHIKGCSAGNVYEPSIDDRTGRLAGISNGVGHFGCDRRRDMAVARINVTKTRTRVLIVDDSPVDRELLTAILSGHPDIEVAGQAADALEAREMVKSLRPCLLTLDVNMQGMDGIRFLRQLMRLNPLTAVVISGRSAEGAEALQAIAAGAIHYIPKHTTSGLSLPAYREVGVDRVRAAAYATVAAIGCRRVVRRNRRGAPRACGRVYARDVTELQPPRAMFK